MRGNMTNKKSMDFTSGQIIKPLLLFSLPMFVANILQQMYNVTDSIIVGQLLGSNALASIGASSAIINLSISLVIGMTLGVAVTVSQLFGAQDITNVQKAVSTCYSFFISCGILISIIGYILSPKLLEIVNTPPEILYDALSYLRITFMGTTLMIGYNVANAIYRGLGNSRLPLIFLIISTIFNIILDIVFVKKLNLGVKGTALATIISQAISFILSFSYYQRNYRSIKLSPSNFNFELSLLKKVLKIGVPSGIKGGMYWGGFVVITSLINSYGPNTVAAYSIASRIDSILQSPLISLQHALSTYVGQNYGARKKDRIKTGVKTSMLIGLCFSLIMTLIVFLLSNSLLSLFTDNRTVIEIGTQYLHITSMFYIIYALQEVVQGVAIGSGDTIILMISTITAMWIVRIPCAYFFSSLWQSKGIWLSLPTGWFVAAIFANGYYLSGHWKKKIDKKNKA